MRISDLKKVIAVLPDDAEVLIWVNVGDGGIEYDNYEARAPIDWHISYPDQIPALHIKVD